MSRRSAKPGKAAAAGGRKRGRRADDDDDAAGFFLLDDDEPRSKQQAAESEEDEEAQETAEQKRVRLAREYLQRLKAATAGLDDDDEGEGAGEDEGEAAAAAAEAAGDAALAQRLRLDALEAQGRLQRQLAHLVRLPDHQAAAAAAAAAASSSDGGGSRQGELYGAGRFARAHRQSPTAVALSSDESTAFSVSKDGVILRWDLETMTRSQIARPGSKAAAKAAAAAGGTSAEWVARGPRHASSGALLAAALSSDGKLLAVGGGDRLVHVFDAPSGAHVASYPGHRDTISGLSFRDGTHTLYSCGYDRTVKIWSVDDGAYVDTLFGHQAEVFAIAAARTDRVVSVGHDHTARLWKIPEESHLVFRSPSMAQHAVTLLGGGGAAEWVTGGCDGTLQVWHTLKKKPVSVTRNAHAPRVSAPGAASTAAAPAAAAPDGPPPSGSWAVAGADTPGWVQSLAAARGADLLASGAGDGCIRLWGVTPSAHGSAGGLKPAGALPAPGFVNGLALGRSGRLCVAAVGQEPRLGRWGRVAGARNGLLVHRWELDE